MSADPTNPDHYKTNPSGVECIEVTEHLDFCRGNAVKYLWRLGQKGSALEDARKALWYWQRWDGSTSGGDTERAFTLAEVASRHMPEDIGDAIIAVFECEASERINQVIERLEAEEREA